jgi:hypothetical protein
MKKNIIPLLYVFTPLFLSLLSISADADFYKYIDKNGTTHFTEYYESIPKEYRNQIKTIREETRPQAPAQSKEGAEKKEGGEAAAEEKAAKEKEAALKAAREKAAQEREAQEKKLKARQEIEKQIEELRKGIEARQAEQRSLFTTWMVRDRNVITRLNQEIEELSKQIRELQGQLDAKE